MPIQLRFAQGGCYREQLKIRNFDFSSFEGQVLTSLVKRKQRALRAPLDLRKNWTYAGRLSIRKPERWETHSGLIYTFPTNIAFV